MSPWQRYMSGADVTGATSGCDVSPAYCPVCTPVYASAHSTQYQRYGMPQSTCCRQPDLDVYGSPDLLGPLTVTSATQDASLPAAPSVAAAIRAVSCSAPDLIELTGAQLTFRDPA